MPEKRRKLWERGDPLDKQIERFTVGRDAELDLILIPFDALGSMAHATMLAEIGVLPEKDLPALKAELAVMVEDLCVMSF